MNHTTPYKAPSRNTPATHQRNSEKLARIPVKVITTEHPARKPAWIRAKVPLGNRVSEIKQNLRKHNLFSVCEEAACPNLGECFSKGTATFMIMGDLCTRRCPFCDVAHGKPQPLDTDEPKQLALAIEEMQLGYVVITSVDRDDLRDGGAGHFASCIHAIRERSPHTRIEILVPDFRGRMPVALEKLGSETADVFNHNLETVPRLYKQARPGADYKHSLALLAQFKISQPTVKTKSGLMLGLGEEMGEVIEVMRDLRQANCEMLTLGQYLQPSLDHLPVVRYVTPDEFDQLATIGHELGFAHVASGPMVRSSYHADVQAEDVL